MAYWQVVVLETHEHQPRAASSARASRPRRRPTCALERDLEPAVAVEVIAALPCECLRHIRHQCDVVRYRRHDAGGHAPVDVLRGAIRNRPAVDDERGPCRTELDATAVSANVVN